MKFKIIFFAVLSIIFLILFLIKGHKMNIGIKLENMDLTVNPGDNFYDYSTKKWRESHKIPDDHASYGTFNVLHDKNLEQLHNIIKNNSGKIGLLYKIAMNEEKLNKDGIKPTIKILNKIDSLEDKKELPSLLGWLHKISGGFWGDSVSPDEKDSNFYIYNIFQSGIGLSRDYYFDNDEKSEKIRDEYKKYLVKILDNFNIKYDALKLYSLEEKMAKSFSKKEDLRDPFKNYNKMSYRDFKKEFSGFDWDLYYSNRGIKPTQININQPKALKNSIEIINKSDLDLIKAYLKLRFINSCTSALDDKTFNIGFDFYSKILSGKKQPLPRWKRTIGFIEGSLGEELGRIYTEKYFPESSKKRMAELVKNLKKAYKERIENLDWMTENTKKNAILKLESFKAKIGYPDVWRDYSKLEIKEDSLFDNMIRVAEFEDKFWLDKNEKQVDPNIWYMNAFDINAYYDPSRNEICFPAGILQPPFFDVNADDAFNYGAIGSIIGHEMTHGFDDQGRHFDKEGNLKDWWTKEDSKNFEKRTKVLVDFFDNIKINKEIRANGKYTLGENLADFGGVLISFTAFKNFGEQTGLKNNLSPEKRFFIAYANTWATNIRDEQKITLTKIDVHSLPENRVNGILPHIDYWYDTFNIKEKDKMYIKKENRLKLW